MNTKQLMKLLGIAVFTCATHGVMAQDTDSSELQVTATVRAAAAINCEEPVDFGKLVILDTGSTSPLAITMFEQNGLFTASMNSTGASHSGGSFGKCIVTAPGADSVAKTVTLTFPTSNSAFQAFDVGPSNEYEFSVSAIDPSSNTLQSGGSYNTNSVTSEVLFKGATRCGPSTGNCSVRNSLSGDYSSTIDVGISISDAP